MNFLSINNYTNNFIMKLLVYIQIPINKFKNILLTMCLSTRATQQKNTIVTLKVSHHTLHSPACIMDPLPNASHIIDSKCAFFQFHVVVVATGVPKLQTTYKP
jgi:hypothetical protein